MAQSSFAHAQGCLRKSQLERGLHWFEFSMFFHKRYREPRSITFAEVATHNNFVLDANGRVFKQTAPIIKLKAQTTDGDAHRLLGVLNSSVACFWLRQVCFPKGGDHQGTEGARVRASLWDERFAFNGTQVAKLPLPGSQPSQLPTALVKTSTALQGHSPAATLTSWGSPESGDLRRDEQRRVLITAVVAVEVDVDAQQAAPPAEFGRARGAVGTGEFGEKEAFRGKLPQQGCQTLPNPQMGHLARLLALVGYGALGPVDVFSVQPGRVALGNRGSMSSFPTTPSPKTSRLNGWRASLRPAESPSQEEVSSEMTGERPAHPGVSCF